jgi:hypothetical protein
MAVTSATRSRETSNGESPFDLDAAPKSGAQRRGSEVLIGLLMVVLFSLAAVWFYITSTASESYVFLAEDVERGQVLERSDLVLYQVSTEADLRAIAGADALNAIGKVALTDLSAGTLLSTDQLAGESEIAEGFGVVGLELNPGEYPTPSLRPGDRVRVVAVLGDRLDNNGYEVLVEAAEVVEVESTGSTGRLVSLTMPSDEANLVALADAQDVVRLVQVPEG